jgi:hypothetical protein
LLFLDSPSMRKSASSPRCCSTNET